MYFQNNKTWRGVGMTPIPNGSGHPCISLSPSFLPRGHGNIPCTLMTGHCHSPAKATPRRVFVVPHWTPYLLILPYLFTPLSWCFKLGLINMLHTMTDDVTGHALKSLIAISYIPIYHLSSVYFSVYNEGLYFCVYWFMSKQICSL